MDWREYFTPIVLERGRDVFNVRRLHWNNLYNYT